MSTDNRSTARLLAASRLADLHLKDSDLARMAAVDVKTVRGFLGKKERWPNRENRAKISEALGWPADEIDNIERTGGLSPAAIDEAPTQESLRRIRASELTDDELLSELTYRMRSYAITVESLGGDPDE